MTYSLLIASSEAQALRSMYDGAFDVHVAEPSAPLLEQIDRIRPHLLVLDAQILLSEPSPYADIVKDKIYHDLPLIAYYNGEEEDVKFKLYEFSVKGICHLSDSPELCIESALDVLARSNPHVGSIRDKFIKAFINYEDARFLIIDALYLANYLIRHFRIEPFKASNIRLAIILLTVGFKKRKIRKIVQLVETLEISAEVLLYLKNYHKPSSPEEEIIVAAMSLVEQDHNNPLLLKAYEALDPELVALTEKAVYYHKIYIACTHDIYVFIMRFNKILGELHTSLEKIELYIEYLRDILMHTLVRYGNFYAQINCENGMVCISATLESEQHPFDDETLSVLHCHCGSDTIEFQISNYTLLTCMKFEAIPKFIEKEEEIFTSQDPIAHIVSASDAEKTSSSVCAARQIDTSFINCMHYEEHQKISAQVFLQEFEYDTALLDDLNENENDAKDALYFDDELTPDILEILIETLIQYTHILNETIEFRDLAYSINSLIALLQSLDLETVDADRKRLLKTYLTGVFENLENWKDHIFIAQDSPDIHYLDASLLSDCSLVESLFIADTGTDDSELEFF